jgi:hypothetical protein
MASRSMRLWMRSIFAHFVERHGRELAFLLARPGTAMLERVAIYDR